MKNALLGLAALATIGGGCAHTNPQRTGEQPSTAVSTSDECWEGSRTVEAPVHPQSSSLTARGCLDDKYPNVEAFRRECSEKAGYVFYLHSYDDDRAGPPAHWECGPKSY